MGGTASPLVWRMGYDPLIDAVADIAGNANPTYVDDLAALIASPGQALRAAIAPPRRDAQVQRSTHGLRPPRGDRPGGRTCHPERARK
eukprot:8501336-Pyramimonas_sp.AAC.1